jgi:hypothetical protein
VRGRTTAVISILGLVVSCTNTLDPADIPGEYVATYSFGTDRIVLLDDGRYTQEVAIPEQKVRVFREGHWQRDPPETPLGHGSVRLGGCVRAADGFGKKRERVSEPMLCVFPIERDWYVSGRLRLMSAASAEHMHLKQ